MNNLNFVSNILGIKNLVHKQKLALKATDVVLFGAPKRKSLCQVCKSLSRSWSVSSSHTVNKLVHYACVIVN